MIKFQLERERYKNMNYDKILKIVEKNNGYITTSEVVDKGIDKCKIFWSNSIIFA